MSIAITFGDLQNPMSLAGAIYFSATTDYSREFKGKVTEHTIEAGALITDHYVADNPVVKVSGVISSVDFSNIPSNLLVEGMQVFNNQAPPNPVNVFDKGGTLRSLVPDVVSQFMPNLLSSVVQIDGLERENKRDEIESFLLEVMSGLVFNEDRQRWENRMTHSKLFMVDGITTQLLYDNLVCTSISIKENADTGDELDISMVFEQVRYVTLEQAEAPTPPKKSTTAKKTEPEKDKGNVPAVNKPTEQAPTTYRDALAIIRGER